jgi:hypothetical protein
MITDSNQACLAKMTGRRLQEEANEISLFQFSKMSRWGEITSSTYEASQSICHKQQLLLFESIVGIIYNFRK